MSPTRVVDRDDRRPDYEWIILGIGGSGFIVGGVILYVAIDAYRVTGKLSGAAGLWTVAGLCLLGALIAAGTDVRSIAWGRVLTLDPVARTFAVSRGLRRPDVLRAGGYDRHLERDGRPDILRRPDVLRTGGYGDFAAVRLERKVRRVYGQRYVRRMEFWAVMLAGSDATFRPICLEEFAGEIVEPKPWLRSEFGAARRHSRAAVRRWSEDLGVPALDPSPGPPETTS